MSKTIKILVSKCCDAQVLMRNTTGPFGEEENDICCDCAERCESYLVEVETKETT